MRRLSATAPALPLFVAGLACTLAVPWRRGASAPVPAQTNGPTGVGPQEAAFHALLASGESGELAPEERHRLLATTRSMGSPALARFLLASAPTTAAKDFRRVALECLEGCATSREVMALVRLATPAEGAPSSEVRAGLRAALVATLERDARAFGELVPAWRAAGVGVRETLLEAVGECGDPAGLELLAWVATFEGQSFHRTLAETCLRLAPRARGPDARGHLETLCVLFESDDGLCVQTLSIALARARVEAAIPQWIALLECDSGERARRSLEELTGLALGPTGERWLARHESERAWYEGEAPALLAELESDDDGRVLTALRELALHRLKRDELGEAVGALLDHPSSAVRACACSALENIDSPVARGAWSALRRLTNLDLPPDEALWRERVAASR